MKKKTSAMRNREGGGVTQKKKKGWIHFQKPKKLFPCGKTKEQHAGKKKGKNQGKYRLLHLGVEKRIN